MKDAKRMSAISHTALMFLSVMALAPFLLMVVSSLTSEESIVKNGYSFWPEVFSLDSYSYIIEQWEMIGRGYLITIIVTVIGVSVSVMITSMLGYMLSQRDLPGKKLLTFYVVFTMLFNGGLVPTYLVYTNILHIKDTLWALIVPTLLLNGFNTILVKNYFTYSVPYELREAASIDGASEYGIFFKIIMPISRPILATIGLMTGLMYWNDWQNGLYYLDDKKLYGIQNILNAINDNVQYLLTNAVSADTSAVPWIGVRMAIAVIGVLPILIVYPFFQEYFVK
ncbi:MAG: carbohydrate ABC transporter permease, partial [Clostridiales bacterium]|nr:carbohydrate ABC transporter permease [Clostridiales bacterium]